MRKGLARAIAKFDEYELAKYDRDSAVKLRDVLRLVRPTPKDEAQSALWKRVKERTLTMPDTWEVALSGGADKKATFERLLRERKLGYLALLRNLRNMVQAGVDVDLVRRGDRRPQGRRAACAAVPLCGGSARSAAVRADARPGAVRGHRRDAGAARQDHRAGRRLRIDGRAGCRASPT